MKDKTEGWQSINKYSDDDLKEFMEDGYEVLVHVAGDTVNGPYFFAQYYHETGWYVMDGFGNEEEKAAITHWMHLPELPY